MFERARDGTRPAQVSAIPRLYHSSACLTVNGTVLVAGCDTANFFKGRDEAGVVPSPTGLVELRVEVGMTHT